MSRYDVVIVDTETSKIVSVTGRNLDARQAERREYTTLTRVNIGPFFVATVPAGKYEKGSTYEGEVHEAAT